MQPKIELSQDALEKILERLSAIEKRLTDTRFELVVPIEGRLSAIESRLNELGPSHAELMGDVEALAEKMSAMQKEIDVLEGERPEVCELPLPLVGLAMSVCGPVPACIASAIRHETEEAEKRKREVEPCHRNPTRVCALRNVVNRMDCAICEEYAQKVLDSMRAA
jgi:chromosome segregation ATPase